MPQRLVITPWDLQPQELANYDPDHPLARALDLAWIGNDPGGVDVLKGHKVALTSGTTITRTIRGNAYTNTGTAGAVAAIPAEVTLPYVQIGYGFFNTAGGAWQLSFLNTAAGGYLSRIALASSTTISADVRWNFGTQRTLTITLPTTLNTPICAALVAYSSTDYRFFCNGQQQNGTLTPGTFGALDRIAPPGDTINGGVWFTGFGAGVAITDADMLDITANPEARLWGMFQRRIWVPVAAGGPDITLSLSGQAVTASAGNLGIAVSNTLTGQSLTASAGALVPNFSIPLVGSSVTASAGTLTYSTSSNITLTLSGSSVTVSAGTLGVAISRSLSGSAVTASAGSLVPSLTLPLSGAAVTVSAGTLTYAPAAAATITVRAGSWIRYKAV